MSRWDDVSSDLPQDHATESESMDSSWSNLRAVAADVLRWIQQNAKTFLAFAVIFQVTVLFSMIWTGARPLVAAGSRNVLLHVVPVDPRDLLRGDFVTLSYDVSRIPSNFPLGSTVYVTLEPEADGQHYRSAGCFDAPPVSGVYLRGTVARPGLVEFGLEKYFLPEGTGKDYENAVRDRRLWASVAVAPDGQAGLRSLVIE